MQDQDPLPDPVPQITVVRQPVYWKDSRLKDHRNNKQLVIETLGTILQQRGLSSKIPASQKGVFIFVNPPD